MLNRAFPFFFFSFARPPRSSNITGHGRVLDELSLITWKTGVQRVEQMFKPLVNEGSKKEESKETGNPNLTVPAKFQRLGRQGKEGDMVCC